MGRSTETLDMKLFVVIALAGAAVASPSNRNDDDGAAEALECTAGTNIGDKLANAFSSCFGSMAGMRKEVKRIQLARNDEQCYSYDEIMQWVEEEYADDACVLQSIGWMGNDFEFDEDQIEADVMSLDPVVTASLCWTSGLRRPGHGLRRGPRVRRHLLRGGSQLAVGH